MCGSRISSHLASIYSLPMGNSGPVLSPDPKPFLGLKELLDGGRGRRNCIAARAKVDGEEIQSDSGFNKDESESIPGLEKGVWIPIPI